MRAVAQRVSRAKVTVSGGIIGEINRGLLLLISAGQDDVPEDVAWMAKKILALRCFADGSGKMNLSVLDIDGEILAVSQFTLHGECRKGNRPSFVKAMEPATARRYFDDFVNQLKAGGARKVETGEFGAMMQVELINDGPVTLLLDSKKNSAI
ncbi:MAG: D-tyrosyl-tRNA(Tyr) deacylase [Myxococcales bacterium]|nr:MAG: D-tyrosyl-tRNA(Tyr) deacylase [Myxococcales bacterium]